MIVCSFNLFLVHLLASIAKVTHKVAKPHSGPFSQCRLKRQENMPREGSRPYSFPLAERTTWILGMPPN